MANITFNSDAHQDFYVEMMNKSRIDDTYHRAFFYVMGICAETRENIGSLFDFAGDSVKFDGLQSDWQTGTTIKACYLAFNLWNGCILEENSKDFTPYELFCCECAPYFLEAIKIRYPEYFYE